MRAKERKFHLSSCYLFYFSKVLSYPTLESIPEGKFDVEVDLGWKPRIDFSGWVAITAHHLNHNSYDSSQSLIGGFTLTGIVGSIMGINILENVELLPITFIASLLPDNDHPRSILGRILKPISQLINRKYGHRSITHGLNVMVALVALILGFQFVYFLDLPVATVFG